jgi:NAD(P)-dependent dehydrogenase (short-subunit alcohol dehydrogenase family)
MPMYGPRELSEVKDKVFLVTGGAAGVGAGIVRALLMDNARVSSSLHQIK